MNVYSTVSKVKEGENSGSTIMEDTPLDKGSSPEELNADNCEIYGTFVYLKARKGMKSEPTQNATGEWKPTMWTYLR